MRKILSMVGEPFRKVASQLLCRIMSCYNTSITSGNPLVLDDLPWNNRWSSFPSEHTGATVRGVPCISTCQNSTILMCNYAAVEKSRPWFGSAEWEVCLPLALALAWDSVPNILAKHFSRPSIFFFSVLKDWTWINVSAIVPVRCWNG